MLSPSYRGCGVIGPTEVASTASHHSPAVERLCGALPRAPPKCLRYSSGGLLDKVLGGHFPRERLPRNPLELRVTLTQAVV